MSKTIVEKILSRASGVDAHAGQIVTAPVDVMFCHDGNRPLGAEVFDTYGASKVCDAKRVIQIMDHAPSCPTESVAKMHAYMRDFSQRQGVKLYECGEGSCHQLISEQGHVKPGYIVIATDSHTCTHRSEEHTSELQSQCCNTVAAEFQRLVVRTVRAQQSGQIQNNVLGIHPFGQTAFQHDPDRFRNAEPDRKSVV